MLDSITIPSPKSFHDERHEGNALNSAVLVVGTVFGVLPHLDGGGRKVRSAMDDSFLRRRDDTDVKSNLLAVDPGGDVDVGGTRLRTWDETRHFRCWAERGELRLLENFVPNSVMPAAFHPVIVTAVKSVIAEFVQVPGAVVGAAFTRSEELKTEAISHRRSERPGVEVEVEERRGLGVDPVTCVRESERKEPSFISARSAVGEKCVVVDVYFPGERMLSGVGREKFGGRVSRVARLLLEKRKNSVGSTSSYGCW